MSSISIRDGLVSSDYEFAKDRFKDPVDMLKQLSKDGFHTCLWQLPYFTPKNRFFPEIIERGLHVVNATGGMPVEDAILDFSNPETVSWYQSKIEGLMKQGVSTIKCDFGEAAPYNGFYHSGKGGLYEHNLYPLRYNKALWEVVEKNHPGEGIIWARSAWAGSQRYALHWGGDAATNNIGMLGDLRGGLSFGLSGFSFWSHDMGGFVTASPEDIYRRWLPFGFLSSHTRAHGAPPTEPWLISESFTQAFRECAEMKYRLMPYVYAQAKDCTERGLPMVRALLVEFPEDPGAWLVEDEYMFGSQMLVAPLLESGNERVVYLPKGKWIDYQTGKVYEGGYQNYCNTSFSLPQKVECKMGGSKVSFNQPDVCNIISSGRYVATVCRETIEIPYVGQKQVQVVYPIYDQHVNLSCGFTFYGDTAYNVCWLKNRCMVYKDTKNPVPTDGMIYMTNGVPGTICFSNIRYQPSQTVIGYEWPLAITQEGTLDTGKPYFLTYKKGKDFYLKQKNGTDQSGRLEGLPGWSYSNGRMVRKKESEYFYYWNPTEVSL